MEEQIYWCDIHVSVASVWLLGWGWGLGKAYPAGGHLIGRSAQATVRQRAPVGARQLHVPAPPPPRTGPSRPPELLHAGLLAPGAGGCGQLGAWTEATCVPCPPLLLLRGFRLRCGKGVEACGVCARTP